jgi:hypothetical protein
MIMIRVVVAIMFFAAMAGWKWFAHVAVDAGPAAWVLVFAGLGLVGYVVTNHDEKAAGRPGYAWPQARRELVFPLGGLVAILLVVWALR